MTLIELKKTIHEKVDTLEDEDLLEMVNSILVQNDNTVYEIPKEHLADINQGMEDVKNGNFITLEQFEKRYEKLLKD